MINAYIFKATCRLMLYLEVAVSVPFFFLLTRTLMVLADIVQRTVQNFLRPTQKYAIQRAIRKVFV